MPSVQQILTQRAQRGRHSPLKRLGLGCSALLSLLFALGGVGLTIAFAGLSRSLPPPEALPALLEPPDGLLLQPTELLDRTGQHVLLTLENPAAAQRKVLDAPPSVLISATLAASAPSFTSPPLPVETPERWLDELLSPQPSLARLLVEDLLLGDEPSGLRRTLRARLLAAQVVSRYGQAQAAEWFINSADYGRLAFGADAAARVYLGKTAEELSLAEAALLAAIPGAPALNPLDAPQAARERQGQVLRALLQGGEITISQYERARREKLSFRAAAKEPAEPVTQAFTRLVLEQLNEEVPRSRLERGGFRVITTLDYDLQVQANCALAAQLSRLEDPSAAGADAACPAARLLPTLPPGSVSPGPGLTGEALALDPASGQVLALTGSRALTAHPAGSLLSPFIYLTGFARGLSPATMVWDLPRGSARAEAYGPLRLRLAAANDYPGPRQGLLTQLGPESVLRTARPFGLLTEAAEAGPGWRLEEQPLTLLEAGGAFGAFANRGVLAGRFLRGMDPAAGSLDQDQAGGARPRLQPAAVLRLEDWAGHILLDWSEPQTLPITSPQLAYLVSHVYSDELARRPSLGHPNPLEVGRPAAAVIGRVSGGGSAWTVGYSPQLVVGAWLSGPNGETGQPVENLPLAAAGLWHALIQHAHLDRPYAELPLPPGISQTAVCDPSGLLPTADCPSVVNEVFLNGTEPTEADPLYRRIAVNRETGRLATIFTPPELVEERVFLVPPPEALDWAREAGLPIPPEDYDAVPLVSTAARDSAQVQLSSPGMFAAVRGKVALTGSAGGEGFDFYRLQVGQGLNPTGWLQVGEESSRPVSDGRLGVWDTSGLSGLYVVQLLVVDADREVRTAAIQVTVDNAPPEVDIVFPRPEGILEPNRLGQVTFQISAADNLGLERVRVEVDGEPVTVFRQPPYALPWEGKAGEHALVVTAIDRAGNETTREIQFTLRK